MTHTSDRAEVVTAQFDWQRSEVAQALRQIARLRPQSAWRRRLPVLLTIMLAAAGLFLIVGVMTKGSAALVGSLPWIAVLAAWLVLFRGGAAWLTAWQMSRNNPHMLSGQTHVMNASGYAVACGGTSSTVTWDGVVQVTETPEFFLTFPVRNAAYYLPKRCLTPGQMTDLRQMLRNRLGERAVLLAV